MSIFKFLVLLCDIRTGQINVDGTVLRSLGEVKWRRARLEPRWGDTLEALVLFRFACSHRRGEHGIRSRAN